MSVSIIIPTFNRLSLLIETIENLLKQTISPDEIIVVDNGSTDGTSDYVNRFYHDRIILTDCSIKSPGAARNKGYEISTGKYIQFLDSDDIMTHNKIEVQIKVIKGSDKGLVYSPYVHVTKNDSENIWLQEDVILQHIPIPLNKTLHQCMVKGFFTIIPGFLFDRNFLKELGTWREDISAYEDWDYLWRIGNLCPNPPHTNECCYFYRVHGQQTTGTNFNDRQRDIQKIRVFHELYKQYVESDPKLTLSEKSFFKAQILSSMKQSGFEKIDEGLYTEYSDSKTKLASSYLRMESKINRIITGSDWQIIHGICKSKEQFEEYLKII